MRNTKPSTVQSLAQASIGVLPHLVIESHQLPGYLYCWWFFQTPQQNFHQEFGVPDKLTFDGSQEQNGKRTEFMHHIRKNDIDYHIIEPERHNENPVEGVIWEVQRKWYHTMIWKRVPKKFWDYSMWWVCEVMQRTHVCANRLDGCVPIEEVNGETSDISEYLDFGFYDRVWYHANAGLGGRLNGQCLGVAHRIGSLILYWILTQTGSVIARTTVQRVTSL